MLDVLDLNELELDDELLLVDDDWDKVEVDDKLLLVVLDDELVLVVDDCDGVKVKDELLVVEERDKDGLEDELLLVVEMKELEEVAFDVVDEILKVDAVLGAFVDGLAVVVDLDALEVVETAGRATAARGVTYAPAVDEEDAELVNRVELDPARE